MDGSVSYLPEGMVDETGTLITWEELRRQGEQRERERRAKYVKAERARIREWAEKRLREVRMYPQRDDSFSAGYFQGQGTIFEDLLRFLEEE